MRFGGVLASVGKRTPNREYLRRIFTAALSILAFAELCRGCYTTPDHQGKLAKADEGSIVTQDLPSLESLSLRNARRRC